MNNLLMSAPENNTPHHNQPSEQDTKPDSPANAVDDQWEKVHDLLRQLVSHSQEQTEMIRKHQQNLTQQRRAVVLRKMAIEVPPVVLAVLLAFGINSWWQQRRATQLASQSMDNIIIETRANLALYQQVVRQDKRNLERLNQQIDEVKAGVIHLDTLHGAGRGYGQGINTFVMQEGAWQAATLTGGIAYFSPNLIQDASEMYSRIHYRNVDHAGLEFGGHERYQKEALLAFLLENQDVLLDHINNCTYDMSIIQGFLKKYDPGQASGKPRE